MTIPKKKKLWVVGKLLTHIWTNKMRILKQQLKLLQIICHFDIHKIYGFVTWKFVMHDSKLRYYFTDANHRKFPFYNAANEIRDKFQSLESRRTISSQKKGEDHSKVKSVLIQYQLFFFFREKSSFCKKC